MANEVEIAQLAAQQRHAERVAACAAELRAAAQAEYNAAVGAQQTEIAQHTAAMNALDQQAAQIAADRVALTAEHVVRVQESSSLIAALTPQLAVEYWATAAEARVAAMEGAGR